MIPLVGMIVAVYAMARLLQVPVEAVRTDTGPRIAWLWLVSVPALLIIAFLAVTLMFSGASATPGLTR